MSSRKPKNGGGATLQLRKKKKTMAEMVNDQMQDDMTGRHAGRRGSGKGGAAAAAYDPFLEEEGNMGIAEEYEWNEDAAAEDDGFTEAFDDANGSSRGGKGAKKLKGNASSSSTTTVSGAKRSRSGGAAVDNGYGAPAEQRLRRRGPLDDDLSQGKYAAQPVANVEAMMDDLFGDLDMGDIDAEGEEEVYGYGDGADSGADDGEEEEEEDSPAGGRRGKKAGAKKAKDLTEEEYMAYLAEKRKKRKAVLSGSGLSLGEVDGEEGAILEQLESLRQAQVSLVNQGGAAGAQDKGGEDTLRSKTQEAVKHYIMLYSQLLRIRVKLQPAVTKAVSMPQYYAKKFFTKGMRAEDEEEEEDSEGDAAASPVDISEAYDDVVAELMELLALLYSFTSLAASAKAAAASATSSASASLPVPSFAKIQSYHRNHVKKNADACLEYWGSKLVQTNSAKLKAISQPLPQQIEAILANMPRLRSKVQKNRAHLPILAHPDHERAAAAKAAGTQASPADDSIAARNAEAALKRAMVMAEGDVDEEIFDDSDFLRELVRRGGAVAHRLEQQLADINRETLPAKEASRTGFHRRTKGKEVSYDARPKLVGFLMSEDLESSGRNDVVLKSLFQ